MTVAVKTAISWRPTASASSTWLETLGQTSTEDQQLLHTWHEVHSSHLKDVLARLCHHLFPWIYTEDTWGKADKLRTLHRPDEEVEMGMEEKQKRNERSLYRWHWWISSRIGRPWRNFIDEDLNVERSPTTTGDIHCYKEIMTQEDSNAVNPRFLL